MVVQKSSLQTGSSPAESGNVDGDEDLPRFGLGKGGNDTDLGFFGLRFGPRSSCSPTSPPSAVDKAYVSLDGKYSCGISFLARKTETGDSLIQGGDERERGFAERWEEKWCRIREMRLKVETLFFGLSF